MLVHQLWLQGWKHAPTRLRERVESNRGKWGANSVVWLWDEEKLVKLLELQYPAHLEWYLSLQRVISKCDAARAFILHAFGGVYADCDFDPIPETIESFARLAGQRVVFIGSPWYGCNNYLIASTPYAPFWFGVYLPHIKQQLTSPSTYDMFVSLAWSTWPVMSSSGPVALGRLLKKHASLAFATPPSTEYDFGYHGSRGDDSNSWYRFSVHRKQQIMALLVLFFACVGVASVSKAGCATLCR
jgi:mannosyltransferase OCH1-like enzyme